MVELKTKLQNRTASAFRYLLIGRTNTDYSPEDLRKAQQFLNLYAERDMNRVIVMRELDLPKGTVAEMQKLYRRYKEDSL